MNVLIIGLGEVGAHLAKVLSLEGKVVTVVDPDPHKVKRLSESLDVTAIVGDGSRPDFLDRAEALLDELVERCVHSDVSARWPAGPERAGSRERRDFPGAPQQGPRASFQR